jgi:hypothetical protein
MLLVSVKVKADPDAVPTVTKVPLVPSALWIV